MKKQTFVATAVLAGALCFGPQASGQKPAQVKELRQQIRLLQKKLDSLESSGKQNGARVTQIGANRVRARRENEVVVKIYDLGDLFAIAPPYVAQHAGDLTKDSRPLFSTPLPHVTGGYGGGLGGGFGGGGGFFNVNPNPEPEKGPRQTYRQVAPDKTVSAGRITIDSLVAVMKQVIAPEVWLENGGNASIAKLGNALLISADADTHEQIDKLLNTFRKRWGTLRTISVQAWWLWMDDKQVRDVLAKMPQPKNRPGTVRAFGLVNEAAWNKHLDALQKEANKRPAGYRAVLTCYNGQTVNTLSGSQSLAVTQVRPVMVKDANEKLHARVAYRPEVAMIQDGVALQVTPIANVAGKTVVLDVHSRVAKAAEEPQARRPQAPFLRVRNEPSPREVVSVIDRRKISVQRLATTLRVPVDRTMLIGGMSFTEDAKTPGQLYLFVRVSVQELRNDNEAETPAKKQPAARKEPAIKPGKK